MRQIPFYDLKITDSFWGSWQHTMHATTAQAIYDRFYETGRITTMDCSWKVGDPQRPHHFWGSDVFKWIEGVAYMLETQDAPALRKLVEDVIALVRKGIREDGYYNSFFNSEVGEEIYTNRDRHELYSLGHMIEAGVAWAHATGDSSLLELAKRGADHADKLFRLEGSAAFVTPGHEEIELALIRLADATGEEKYRALSQFFVDQRGNNPIDLPIHKDAAYSQSHLPVRQQTEAVGHAVRALYLYCAMADQARHTGDKELTQAVEALFSDIWEKKMYITGATGSVFAGENFSVPYHLPNQRAYAETCASLSLALFGRRLLMLHPDGRFGDAVEKALYNGMLSGISLEGDAFFYVNPLELDQSLCDVPYEKQHLAQRKKVFGCSCCPPNLLRVIASIGDFIYTWEDDRLFVHQYIANEGTVDGCAVKLEGNYPVSGNIRVSCPGKKLALRRPGWCQSYTASAPCTEKDGYLYFDCDSVQIEFAMEPVFVTAASAVHGNQGRVALMRGPIVYCAEGQDQQADLFRCRIDPRQGAAVTEKTIGGLPVLEASGAIVPQQTALYAPWQPTAATPVKLRMIPYFTFNNRGADDMQVWLLTV